MFIVNWVEQNKLNLHRIDLFLKRFKKTPGGCHYCDASAAAEDTSGNR